MKKNKKSQPKIKIHEAQQSSIDYEKMHNIVLKALQDCEKNKQSSTSDESAWKKFIKGVLKISPKVIWSILGVLLTALSFLNDSNNAALIYHYSNVTIVGEKTLNERLEFEVSGEDAFYARVLIHIEAEVTSGSIKNVYVVSLDSAGNLQYQIVAEGIRKEILNWNPVVNIETKFTYRSKDEKQDVPIWIVFIDTCNNISIDYYEVITESVLKVEGYKTIIDTKYKTKDTILNYRIIQYNNIYETNFLENAQWNDPKGYQKSNFDEDYILKQVEIIRDRFNTVYK